MDWTPYVGPIVTALIAAAGSYAATAQRIAKLEEAIIGLRRDVEKHNQVMERTYRLEARVNVLESQGGTK